VLSKLALDDALARAGATEARNARFYANDIAGGWQTLPQPALCLSRHALDAVLANTFRSLGGELREHARWSGASDAEGTVLASGRRPAPTVGGWKWFGLKAHARGVTLSADLEMHLTDGGYVGLCRVENDTVNVCGLFRKRGAMDEPTREWKARLAGASGSQLSERLRHAEWQDESCCAVAGLDLRPQRAAAAGECRIGDALTMIPPFTGNGMSMSFESAALAAEPLSRWSRGELDWVAARGEIARRCDETFASRLRWAGWLHRALFVESLQPLVVRDLLRVERVWRFLHARTR
jgi:flavin-dependent dehydrogenase